MEEETRRRMTIITAGNTKNSNTAKSSEKEKRETKNPQAGGENQDQNNYENPERESRDAKTRELANRQESAGDDWVSLSSH
jgi:hypothetical protein